MRIQKYPDTCGRGLRETVSQPERQRYCRGRQREKEEGGGGDGEGEEWVVEKKCLRFFQISKLFLIIIYDDYDDQDLFKNKILGKVLSHGCHL